MTVRAAIFHETRHLSETELNPPTEACLMCAGRARNAVLVLQSAPEVSIWACRNCGAASASRMPTRAALENYYSAYYGDHGSGDALVTFNGPRRFGRHLAMRLKKHLIRRSYSILDFGGGDGALSHATALDLLAAGAEAVNILLVDHNERPLKPCDGRITLRRALSLSASQGGHDLVIASAVIEHIPDAGPALKSLSGLVAPGGILYIRTPFVLPLMRLCAFFRLKLDFTFPGHVHDLGQNFWEWYFSSGDGAGNFQILESRPSQVETAFSIHFGRTLAAYLLKAPWWLFGRRWGLVGGWEVFAKRCY